MDIGIAETFATDPRKVICSYCSRSVTYFDKLNTGQNSCLSCSYSNEFPILDECLFNPTALDLTNKEMRVEMTRVAQHDIDSGPGADITIKFPDDLKKAMEELVRLHDSTFNAELIAAFGWYSTSALKKNSPILEVDFDTSIKSESPLELVESLVEDPIAAAPVSLD